MDLRTKIAYALAEKFCAPTKYATEKTEWGSGKVSVYTDYSKPIDSPLDRLNNGMYVHWTDTDGYRSFSSASPLNVVDVIMEVIDGLDSELQD